jgi:hypothetical protein
VSSGCSVCSGRVSETACSRLSGGASGGASDGLSAVSPGGACALAAAPSPDSSRWIGLQLLLDEFDQLDVRQLQQLDGLLQLRRHYQGLGLTKLEAWGDRHGREP